MLSFVIMIGIAFLLQGALSFLQMRHFTNAFLELRRKGKVACGRKSGGFRAGAIVMFGIDDDGIIREARKLEGTTAFAKVKTMEGFEGRYIGSLTREDAPAKHVNLGKAIEDAALTYRKYTAGEDIEPTQTPGLFTQVKNEIGGLLGKKVNNAAVQ